MDKWLYIIIALVLVLISKGEFDTNKNPEATDTVIGLLKDLKGTELLLEEMDGFTEEDVMKEFELFEPENIDVDFDFENGGAELW